MTRPLCFVLMPFGKKPDPAGSLIDFDAVFRDMIRPAIEHADLEPVRADEEIVGGVIHQAMFERLLLCEYAVADLTTANANVFYELGVRHTARPWSTVLIFSENTRLPFDVAPLRALPYRLTAAGMPADVDETREALARKLRDARQAVTDSPLFQLLDGLKPPDIARLKTDVFRERVRYSSETKERLAVAKAKDDQTRKQEKKAIDAGQKIERSGPKALQAIQEELRKISDAEAGVVIDLFLSYRDVEAWKEMIALVDEMSTPLAQTVMVQEQLAMALNRANRGEEAERVLLKLLERRGPSSETYGILGRVYKDRWKAALEAGEERRARGFLDKAIDAYLRGFEADWRDAYPGINAVTLMEIRDPPDPRREKILPVVAYGTERRVASGEPDYWDYATLLELAVLGKDREAAEQAMDKAIAESPPAWQMKSTAGNLELIRNARQNRGETVDWADAIERELRGSKAD